MEDLKKYSNDKLLEMMNTLAINHEKLKDELIKLNEIRKVVESNYVKVAEELKNRN